MYKMQQLIYTVSSTTENPTRWSLNREINWDIVKEEKKARKKFYGIVKGENKLYYDIVNRFHQC